MLIRKRGDEEMNHPMDAVIVCYRFIIYTLFLGFFPWAYTRGICYRKGIPKYNKWVIIVVYSISFLIQLMVCSFITTISKNINLENISAGDKMWIYIKLTVGNSDYVGIDDAGNDETTLTIVYFTKENVDEIGEEFLRRIVSRDIMVIRLYQFEDFEIKSTDGGWYVTIDDEYMASISVKNGLFMREIKFRWDSKKLDELWEIFAIDRTPVW